MAAAGLIGMIASAGHRGVKPRSQAALIAMKPAAPRAAAAVGLGRLVLSPDELRKLSPEEARRWNATIPISLAPNPPARAFVLRTSDPEDRRRALDCLTAAVYYEASSEPDEGKEAVAQVVLNRLRHPAFPKTVCGVVFEGSELPTGCQFTFTCDGSLLRAPSAAGWARARKLAEAALSGFVLKRIGHATHYHTVWVAPYWNTSVAKVGVIGAHIFYRWEGNWGLPGAFAGRYAGAEPLPVAAAIFPAQADVAAAAQQKPRRAPKLERISLVTSTPERINSTPRAAEALTTSPSGPASASARSHGEPPKPESRGPPRRWLWNGKPFSAFKRNW
jgi:hypothetical protein